MGPGCLTAVFGMGTGVTIQVCSPRSCLICAGRERLAHIKISTGSDKSCLHGLGPRFGHRTEQRINAVKRSAVSTGQLRRLPALHTRPIDLVVFQEPSHRSAGDLILGRVSRLDAFSVYPGRT
jgi:hypothetical protein